MTGDECFTCRGIELLFPSGNGKCPAHMFETCDKKGLVKSWMRVCKTHAVIKLPRDRVCHIIIPQIVGVPLDDAQKFTQNVLKGFEFVLKHDLIAKQNGDGTKTVDLSGDVYVVCDSAKNCHTLIEKVNKDRAKDGISAKQASHDTNWIKCNAHKHVCIELNYLEKKRSSCTAGWMKHRARSSRSRTKKGGEGSKEGSMDEEEEEEEEKLDIPKPKTRKTGRGASPALADSKRTSVSSSPVPHLISSELRNNSFGPSGYFPDTSVSSVDKTGMLRKLSSRLNHIHTFLPSLVGTPFNPERATAYCQKWQRIFAKIKHYADFKSVGWASNISNTLERFDITNLTGYEDTSLLSLDTGGSATVAVIRMNNIDDLKRWVISSLEILRSVMKLVADALKIVQGSAIVKSLEKPARNFIGTRASSRKVSETSLDFLSDSNADIVGAGLLPLTPLGVDSLSYFTAGLSPFDSPLNFAMESPPLGPMSTTGGSGFKRSRSMSGDMPAKKRLRGDLLSTGLSPLLSMHQSSLNGSAIKDEDPMSPLNLALFSPLKKGSSSFEGGEKVEAKDWEMLFDHSPRWVI